MLLSPTSSSNNLKQSTYFDSLESDYNYAGIIPRTIYEVFH